MTRRDPLDRLGELGDLEVPGPDPAFAERLEQRLRHRAGLAHRTPGWWTGPRRLRLVTPLAVAAALVFALLVVQPTDDAVPLQVTAAADSTVVRADGSVEVLRVGTELRDGDVVVVGADGSATIGDEALGPDESVVVVDGRLRSRHQPDTAGDRTRPDGEDPDEPVVTTPTTRPEVTIDPTDTVIGTTSTTTTSTTERPPADQPPARMDLRVTRSPDTVRASWSRWDGDRFGSYVLVRSTQRDGGESQVVARLDDRDATDVVRRLATREGDWWRVMTMDGEGRVLAMSDAVQARTTDTMPPETAKP